MILELYAASGGLAEGFRRAGLPVDLAVEWNADACDSYEANFGRRPWQVDAEVLLGWTPPEPIELLIADPPCVPWSRAGKRRGLADERDTLVLTVDLIRRLRPAAYLIGNVPGLDDAPHWPVVQRLLGGLAADGYCVRDFASLDAADYGVPQRRRRPFWYGHRVGPCLRWPAPTHADPDLLARALPMPGIAPTLRPWVTVREALAQHLGDDPGAWGRPVRMRLRPGTRGPGRHGADETRCSRPDAPASTLVTHPTAKGGQILLPQSSRLADPDRPAPTLDTRPARAGTGNGTLAWPEVTHTHSVRGDADGPAGTIVVQGRGGTAYGNVLATGSWPWDRLSTTVRAQDGRIPPPGHHAAGEQLGPNAIVLSERAALVLQGCPPTWTICGATVAARWAQIGQAVPPAVAEAIARAICGAQCGTFPLPGRRIFRQFP